MFIRFDVIHERDRRTDRHCVTAKTALASHRVVKMVSYGELWRLTWPFKVINLLPIENFYATSYYW